MKLNIVQGIKEKAFLEALQIYYEKGWSYFGLPELLDGLGTMNEIELYMKEHNYPKRSELEEFSTIQQRIQQKISELKNFLENSELQTLENLPKQIITKYLNLKEEHLEKEKIMLEYLLKFYRGQKDSSTPMRLINGELEAGELHAYIMRRGYPSPEQTQDILAIQQQILKELVYIEQQQLKFGFNTERTLTGILVIPSWSKLIGTEFKGFFKHTPVRFLERNSVVMVVDLGRGFQEITGEELFLITGPGIYFTEFKLETDLLIQDHREITGIILPKTVYRAMQQATPIYQSGKIRAMITSLASFIPFSIVLHEYQTQAFLRGVIMRNIFSPYKEVFTLLTQSCNTKSAYSLDEGLKILNASSLYFNRLLVESRFTSTSKSRAYLERTAGLADIQIGLENIIRDLFPLYEINCILERIMALKKYYAEYGELIFHNWMPH